MCLCRKRTDKLDTTHSLNRPNSQSRRMRSRQQEREPWLTAAVHHREDISPAVGWSWCSEWVLAPLQCKDTQCEKYSSSLLQLLFRVEGMQHLSIFLCSATQIIFVWSFFRQCVSALPWKKAVFEVYSNYLLSLPFWHLPCDVMLESYVIIICMITCSVLFLISGLWQSVEKGHAIVEDFTVLTVHSTNIMDHCQQK